MDSSFRDSDGYMMQTAQGLYRIVNNSYKNNYDLFMKSGLYDDLINNELLIPHDEVWLDSYRQSHKILKPMLIPYISYPYEWCFSQLKDAALLTLKIQRKALEYGMSLKDASAYNVQFMNGYPIFIDTLSFEKYEEKPWVAYGQFCKHFIAPLSLMAYTDVRLNQLSRIYLDGIPLDLASKLLPIRSRFNLSLGLHLHLHAKMQVDKLGRQQTDTWMSKHAFLGILDTLESCVNGLKWKSKGQWKDYVGCNNYSNVSMIHKGQIVESFLSKIKPKVMWDFGGNVGNFSRLSNAKTVCFDIDPSCVELNYNKHDRNILPLVFDITNPSPAIGWNNSERMSFLQRGLPDTIMALALIHHLCISNNISFAMLAKFMSKLCQSLIIEFVPFDDSQIKRITQRVIPEYTQGNFDSEFGAYFNIKERIPINGSKRVMYHMEKHA